MKAFAVILAAGRGTRFSKRSGDLIRKQFLEFGNQPLWVKATFPFQMDSVIDDILIVCPSSDIEKVKMDVIYHHLTKVVSVIAGGERREDSVFEALRWIELSKRHCDFIFIHDGVRPFVSEMLIRRLWDRRGESAVIPVISISDTVKFVSHDRVRQTLDRDTLKMAQTPQLFSFSLILKAFKRFKENSFENFKKITDDASLIEWMGESVSVIEGESTNIKITVPQDLQGHFLNPASRFLNQERGAFSVGQGMDIHAFTEGNKIVLGGIDIPYSKALKGHSDADVLIHALCDALLGAAGLSDIGTYFSDDDPAYENISSLILLEKVMDKIMSKDYKISHIDVTVVAEKPKLLPYIPEMKIRLSGVLNIAKDQLAIKAKTSEGIGFIGREEGIVALAIATLRRGL